ncbi:hypothetical protein P3X46_018600 [Hevea brasiliensis]|uniref:Uncharacterized protein n=2 Tax=Hevea brasiliensis TaxID=3981 RepID=A0ABQ9LTC9_HEVBR|nr:hypothetical protein P3X46_018600 [Hevea brasiliensis]
MERKKKDHRIASATTHERGSNDLLRKEEQNQSTVAFATKSMGATNPSHDDAPSLNQQSPSILQWPCCPCTPQINGERPSSSSKPCVSAQSPSIAVSQWHQLPHLPLNPASHQGHALPHLAQSTTPFWLPQRPGYYMPGVNAPHASGLVGGGTSSKDHNQFPDFCYQVGYAFPGPWDPSSWCGHIQQSQPPSNYVFPGAYGYFSLQPPTVPDCSAPLGQSSQRGIIRAPEQLMQSAENVQLWIVIGHLQSELADYKSHVTKLESEVSFLKQAMEESTAHVTGTAVSRQVSKRGRPRRSVALVDALPSPDGSQPQVRGRKACSLEKVILNKAEHKMAINGSNVIVPSFPNQVPQEISQTQMSGVEKNDGKTGDINDAFTVMNQEAKGMDNRIGFLASFLGARNNGSLGWPYTIIREGSETNDLNKSSQSFNNYGSAIRQGGRVIPGWSFVNEEDASEELEDAVATSAKDENEEEMEDDATSGGEEITWSKGEGEDLPQFSNR